MNSIRLKIGQFLKNGIIKLFLSNIYIGEKVSIDFKTKIINNSNKLSIGNGVYLRSYPNKYQAAMYYPTTILIDVKGSEVFIGNNSRLNGVYIHAQKKISIGKNCVIAAGVQIIDSNGHVTLSFNRTIGRDKPSEIVIGDNVWIGINAIILKGTKIGNNSVVSAGSVVKGTFPDNCLIVGNPARVVKVLNFGTK